MLALLKRYCPAGAPALAADDGEEYIGSIANVLFVKLPDTSVALNTMLDETIDEEVPVIKPDEDNEIPEGRVPETME